MRNRAKCKLCGDIIESSHIDDFKRCKCNHIFITQGIDGIRCGAGEWNNFTFLDDEGNEIPQRIVLSNESNTPKEKEEEKPQTESQIDRQHDRRKELMDMLLETIKNSENLPSHVRSSYVTYLDLDGALTLIYAILKELPG